MKWARIWSLAGLITSGVGIVGVISAENIPGWIVALAVMAVCLSLVSVSAAWLPQNRRNQPARIIQATFENPWRAAGISIFLLAVWIRGLWAEPVIDLPPLSSYFPLALLWPWFMFGSLITLSNPVQQKTRRVARRIFQVGFWILITGVMLEVLLRMAFLELPPRLRQVAAPAMLIVMPNTHSVMMPPQVPIHNYWWADSEQDYTYDPTDGDLFAQTCLTEAPPPYESPVEVHFRYDEHGFRGDESGDVDMVVIGDSFTQAHTITLPFWDGITDTVYAIGAAGSGSVEQALLLEAFGVERHPKIVIMAFFEGNDLQDSWRFEQARESYEENGKNPLEIHSQFRPLRFSMTYDVLLWVNNELQASDQKCPFPLEDSRGHRLGYYELYFSMFTVETETLRTSEIFAVTRDAILQANDLSRANGATFVLMFIPSKEHTHWRGLVEAGEIDRMAGYFPAFKITEDGFVKDSTVRDATALARQYLDNQRTLLADLAAEEGFLFLDLTSALQDRVAAGEELHFYGDTHLNPAGHDAVRAILRDFLQAHELLSVEDK